MHLNSSANYIKLLKRNIWKNVYFALLWEKIS